MRIIIVTEKQIPWDGTRLDLNKGDQFDPEYLKLNSNAVVPTLVHDGQILTESTIISTFWPWSPACSPA